MQMNRSLKVCVVFSGHHHEHQDKHVNVKEIHISENLQKLEAHGWKVRALVMLSPCYDGSHYYWKEKYSYFHNISGSLSTIKWWVQALSTFWPNLKSERARMRERERELYKTHPSCKNKRRTERRRKKIVRELLAQMKSWGKRLPLQVRLMPRSNAHTHPLSFSIFHVGDLFTMCVNVQFCKFDFFLNLHFCHRPVYSECNPPSLSVNPSSVSSDLRVYNVGLNAPWEFMTYQAMTACVLETRHNLFF